MMRVEITLLISFASLCIAGIVGITNIRRNEAANDRREASTTTTLIVKLENINEGVNEIKSDMRNIRNDVQNLRDRLIIVEQSVNSAHRRLNILEGISEKNELD